jgi:hypothetical protein
MTESDQFYRSIADSGVLDYTELATACVAVLCWSPRTEGEFNPSLTQYDSYLGESFHSAARRLGAFPVLANPHSEESTKDVVHSIQRLTETMPNRHLAALVVRHPSAGVPQQMAGLEIIRNASVAVLNGGDGDHENPTEALLYLHSIWSTLGRIEGLRVLIHGDIKYNPVGRSLLFAFAKLKADLHLVAPSALVPHMFPRDIMVTVHNLPSDFTGIADVVVTLPVRSYVFANRILPPRETFLRSYALSNLEPEQISSAHFVQCRSDPSDISLPPIPSLKVSDDKPDLHGLAVRMAALKFSLFPK